MTVSAERLAEIDAELEALGRSAGEIEAVLARFEAREPEELGAVDAQLADLASGVDFVMPEPAKRPEPAPKRAPAPAADDVDPDDMPTVESADRAGSRLSEEDLFGDTPSDEPPARAPKDYSYLFGPDSDLPPPGEDPAAEGDALLESLEAEIDGFQAPPPGGDETEADPTNVFSSTELESIERAAMASSPSSRAEARRSSDVPSARPPRPPSQHPPARDPEFDALLGDPDAVFRPSQHPPGAQARSAAEDGGTGDFEVLVDDDILVEVDDDHDDDDGDPLDALPSVVPPSAAHAPPVPPMPRPPAVPTATASPSQRPSQRPPGDEEEGGQKKGFFKKLFGGKE